ncbi:MAG: FGGY-family carbohydrate kinase [Acidimicrobiales bacterium]
MWRRTVDGATREEFIVEGSINTAGSVVEWLVRMGLLPQVEQLDRAAGAGRPDAVGFLPALAGLGSPHHDPAARGRLEGLSLDTTAADVVRAALAGIAGRVAELTRHMGIVGALRVDGGLSRSRVMCAEVAAATGLELIVADDPETALAGAAAVAAGG